MADDTQPAAASDLSPEEVVEAQKEGRKEAIVERAKIANAEFDGLPGDPQPGQLTPEEQAAYDRKIQFENRFMGSDEVLGLEPFLELDPKAFDKAIGNGKKDEGAGLTDTQLGGLYKLERNGKNRTPYVQSLRKRLGLEDGEHVPGAGGPGYTNDTSNLTEL